MDRVRAACVQVDAGSDYSRNLIQAEKYFLAAVRAKAKWITFPENFLWRGSSQGLKQTASQFLPAVSRFRNLARKYEVVILLGSLIEKASGKKFFNTSILIDDRGREIARYRKMHLFDIDIPSLRCKESKHVLSGKKAVMAKLGKISAGLAICYDLRFPELFRHYSQQGAKVFFLPANFTEFTGKAHWEVLVRARAIENFAFVIAPGQSGVHPESGIKSFGTSMIVDPWGRVLAKSKCSGSGVITADLDFSGQMKLRQKMPSLNHRCL